MESAIDNHILELSNDTVQFEPVSNLTNVFYDEANCQVFAVRSGGTTGVVVKGPQEVISYSFRMLDKGDVMSIKFSPDKKILSVQRSFKSIEFMNFNEEPDSLEYSQSCKGKNMKILGFSWTNVNEIVFVMDKGIEHYQVIPEKHTLKSLKSWSLSCNWYVYHPDNSLLLISSGSLCNVMHPFQFRQGTCYKLARFEIDLPAAPKLQKVCLLERDVSIATVYNRTCIFVLRHQPRTAGTPGAEIAVYKVIKDGPPRKTDILRLDKSGRFAINVIDNIIVVHHQASKESMMFDINLPCYNDKFISYHTPIVRCPIKPFVITIPAMPSQNSLEQKVMCELYSPNWVVFLPNVIIDPKLGFMWYVKMNLDPVVDVLEDKCLLVDFLLLRQTSKSLILKVCHDALTSPGRLPLDTLAKIFDKLNEIFKLNAELQRQDSIKNSPQITLTHKPTVVIDQADMFSHVFCIFEKENISPKFAVSVLLEYIRSLIQYQQSVQHYLSKLLINIMVQNKQFYQLHQFLQYQILNDSKQLACLMLTLESVYPPAYQLALDMLKRLQNTNEEIVEVLLSQKKILQALSFVRMCGAVDSLSSQKYLSAAIYTGDPRIFYSVYKFFEQRNIRLRGSPDFEPGEHCEAFVKYFNNIYGTLTYEYDN
ncbi:regulator of MON1-CCZ1 complex [Parasteatoda tepidariorum]|uniref:regulator of MON1-CCZ1 complex n=1 Tax=Parasteatoda tepidariorum TaxID=114398 RepID=UPI00077F9BD9|nr:regulator of MON1-CCZ1 complex [Parasteatoda tepidariorum]